MWCIAGNLTREYVERMEDLLDLFAKPYNPAEPVVCLDEKPVKLHAEVRKPKPALSGRIAKRDAEYERCGTANVFCIVEPRAGRHMTRATRKRTAKDFARELKRIAKKYPDAATIHLVMDNLNTHSCKSLTKAFGEKEGLEIWNRFTIHYTPKHGSWLNQAEIEVSLFSRQCLGKLRISSFEDLKKRTAAWNRQANRKKIRINWKLTKRQARKKFIYDKRKLQN